MTAVFCSFPHVCAQLTEASDTSFSRAGRGMAFAPIEEALEEAFDLYVKSGLMPFVKRD